MAERRSRQLLHGTQLNVLAFAVPDKLDAEVCCCKWLLNTSDGAGTHLTQHRPRYKTVSSPDVVCRDLMQLHPVADSYTIISTCSFNH